MCKAIRQDLVREQITASVATGIDVPQPVVEALYRFQNEERTVSFITVDGSAIEPVAAPDPAALQAFFDENKEQFRAPEYRKLALLTLDPTALANPAAVTPEELAAEYERRKANFTRPERRRVEQIRFETREAAEQAMATIKAPGDFATVAASRNLAPADMDQGLKTQAEILDQAVAAAAFAAQPNVPVAVLDNAVEPSIIRVTEIEPGSVEPLEEVAERLRGEVATRLARERIQESFDKVEDERAGGATLEEIAKTQSLQFRLVDAVAKDGTAPDGSPVELPVKDQLLTEAFESDIGVENNPIRGPGESYVFFEVVETIPARDRTLEEAREQVVSAWTAAETEKRVNDRANTLFGRLQNGEALPALAAEIGQPVQTIERVRRGPPPAGLSANAAAQAFAGPEGHVANAEGDTPPARILLRVDRVTSPAYFAEAADAQAIKRQLGEALRNDVLQSYHRQLLQERPTRINNQTYAQITGNNQAQ
jgi:peptidyl-prolyl cis-trans isomerase D